ncbi:hypothetical protein AJ80_05817 [Polytolypa hystricis UAMH7299]|uniref:HbrB-like protein n=1 Tax=Polytolypa hystricis (strain UAMH7299) TaxID=1447883 RepID=A0A2B7Y159_POLH7|nr:hypothetical protein AJ80_05817 [Polytolypa hystricis UAMH7299]
MPNPAQTLRRTDVGAAAAATAMPPTSPNKAPPATDPSARPSSSSNDTSSASSNFAPLAVPKRSLYSVNPQSSNTAHPRSVSAVQSSANGSTASLGNYSRPAALYLPQNEALPRKASPLPPSHEALRHRPRQHSQGFFEPSLPTASSTDHSSSAMSNLSASQIAAQAAMQHQAAAQIRNRSQTIPPRQDHELGGRRGSGESPPPLHTTNLGSNTAQIYQNGVPGGRALAATTAANLAFPRSPGLPPPKSPVGDYAQESGHKHKGEKSKMKLFSKPKHIGISRDKDSDRKDKPMPSPNKLGPSSLSRMMNVSTTSLNEQIPSSNSSMYTLTNSSAATVVLAQPSAEKEKEKEKDKEKAHKHHFLSRQKLKLKDKDDHFHLPLSSASSNSKPLDPNAPQSLYSFTPSSPSTTAFGKSMSGLDLRHGGRALREKKKEEKKKEEKASAAAAAAAAQDVLRDAEQNDWATSTVAGTVSSTTLVGGAPLGSSGGGGYGGDAALKETLQGFGLQNMTPEDAWDFLKAKLLVLFEGEDVRIALEDLNKLVSIHIQRCVAKHVSSVIVEDLRDLLHTGFSSLNHSIHLVSDDKLVPHLVRMWLFVFGTVLPFIQAVFLPLDLEFKGRGSIMTAREAKEFWGALPNGDASNSSSVGDELDVRTIVLVSFRDNIILSRYNILKATFSRLSLESIHANVSTLASTSTGGGIGSVGGASGSRPSTASAAIDPGFGSYNSQSSTLLTTAGSFSSDSIISRSRAASNTSSNADHPGAPQSYTSFSPPQNSILSQHSSSSQRHYKLSSANDASQLITETVGRMLQCISVLASVQSDDDAQGQIETLSKALKLNWLGRGRTGRDRRGFVGTRVRPPAPPRKDSEEDGKAEVGWGSGVVSEWQNGKL